MVSTVIERKTNKQMYDKCPVNHVQMIYSNAARRTWTLVLQIALGQLLASKNSNEQKDKLVGLWTVVLLVLFSRSAVIKCHSKLIARKLCNFISVEFGIDVKKDLHILVAFVRVAYSSQLEKKRGRSRTFKLNMTLLKRTRNFQTAKKQKSQIQTWLCMKLKLQYHAQLDGYYVTAENIKSLKM